MTTPKTGKQLSEANKKYFKHLEQETKKIKKRFSKNFDDVGKKALGLIKQYSDKEFDEQKFINDIFELKKPLFTVKVKDDGGETIINLYADGTCPYETGKNKAKASIRIFNHYRAAISIACALPAKTSTLFKESKFGNFFASYFSNKVSKKDK